MKELNVVIRFSFAASLIITCLSTARAQTRDTMADTWSAADALGRVLPMSAEVGDFRPNRTVGIFYFNWQASFGNKDVYDISKILKADSPVPPWGPVQAPHYWSEPCFGLSSWTGSPISSHRRGSTGIGITEYSRRTTSSGGQSRRWRLATLASGARPRPAGMVTTVTAPQAAATRIKSPARTTPHGLRGPS